jgi:hypothetical protein
VNHENADYPLHDDNQHGYDLEVTQQSTFCRKGDKAATLRGSYCFLQDSIRSRSFTKASSDALLGWFQAS